MFVLDTNILSALMGSQPVPEVATWMSAQPEETLFTAAICQAEILAGIAVLPMGRKRQLLDAAAQAIFEEDFGGRILPFDQAAASIYAALFALRREAGRPIATADLMIAAVTRAHDARLVTRNVADFEGCGIELINPWAAS